MAQQSYDRQDHKVLGYIEPTAEELQARRKRNLAIAASLAVFFVLAFFITIYQFSTI